MEELYGSHTINNEFLNSLDDLVEKNYNIDPALYGKYNVKRGLRNADDTGVVVGLTEIGDVHAYIIDENEKVPVEGRLTYRGIDIYEFVRGFQQDNRFGFEECAYLLMFGELPKRQQLEEFKKVLGENMRLPEGFTRDMILKAPSTNIMNKLARCVLASYSYDDNPDSNDTRNCIRQSVGLMAKFPAFMAYAYQAYAHYHQNQSLHIHSPLPELSTAENILHMIRSDGKFEPSEAAILDLALVLHAEHGGGNNSSFTTHVVTSTGTDTYSAISAALGSLKGPRHGGANIKVMEMMEDIKSHVSDWEDETEVEGYLAKILRKEAFDKTGLIYGIGHAVYTVSDPRAILLKQQAAELAKTKNMDKEFSLYTLIEKLAPTVFKKVKSNEKILCANVDFYSGFVYRMLNIPMELFTPIFACGRIPGWCAHRMEELISGGRIIRPAYKNVMKLKDYVDLSER